MLQQSAAVKAELGQFMTPSVVADFMASMFPQPQVDVVRLLDPGAGVGSLTAAFVQRMCLHTTELRRIEITACEVDPALRTRLAATLDDCVRAAARFGIHVAVDLVPGDFIEHFTDQVTDDLFSSRVSYTHVIANPPYKKIGSQSTHRRLLQSVGIEATNLYAGFVALAIMLLAENGHLVAITPRSFCNGPYFLPFRRLLLGTMALHQIHSFGARDIAFKDDDVLQENLIFSAVRSTQPDSVLLSSSHGLDFTDISRRWAAKSDVFQPEDPNLFIYIPTTETDSRIVQKMRTLCHSLDSLGLSVSTGPVVEFRLKPHIHREPDAHTVPLIYPAHFDDGFVRWPKPNGRKPNAIDDNDETRKWLMPRGNYTLTRRFSSKEERRRVFAAVYDSTDVTAEWAGFENHLNVIHANGKGLPPLLARGLAIYLSSTTVDQFFRLFNGHTQVNATDLRILPYPALEALNALGAQLVANRLPEQESIDDLVDALVFETAAASPGIPCRQKGPA